MYSEQNSDSSSDHSNSNRKCQATRRLHHVIETYFRRIFCSSEFVRRMNQRCSTGNNDSTSYVLLCEAIRQNDTRTATVLLQYHCKTNFGKPDPSKDVPLHLATLVGNVEIIELLLSKGARGAISFYDDKQPLHLICDKEMSSLLDETTRIAIARHLLKYGADINAVEKSCKDTPLMLAVRSKLTELSKFLLDSGADRHYANKHGQTAFQIAFAENGSLDIIQLLHDELTDLLIVDDKGYTAFSYAIRNLMNAGFGTTSLCLLNEPLAPVQFLLRHGIDVNLPLDRRNNHVLHLVCQNNAAQAIKIFLIHGAEVNTRNTAGKAALHYCAEHQPLSYIQLLIAHGADVRAVTINGESVLHFAAANRHQNVLEFLLGYGLDVNAKSRDEDFTPLFNAVWSNRHGNARLLLEAYADVNCRIINEQTALHVAVEQSRAALVRLLLDYGADVNIMDKYHNTALTICLAQQLEVMGDSTSDCSSADEKKHFESIVMMLTKHAAKLVFTNRSLSEDNAKVMENSLFRNLFDDCTNELQRLAEMQVTETLTLLDLLIASQEKLLSYTRNENFRFGFKLEVGSSLFQTDLESRFSKSVARFDVMEGAMMGLNIIFQRIDERWSDLTLPRLILEKIISYLNMRDLCNLECLTCRDK